MLAEGQRFRTITRFQLSACDRLTALDARGTENSNDQHRGNDKAMRERRVGILRDRLTAQNFLSIANLMASTGVDSEPRIKEGA